MSFSSHIKVGAVAGLTTGLVTSAFFSGAAKRAERRSLPGTFILAIFAPVCLVGGPFIGAGTGASLYGAKRAVKYLRVAPRPIQVTVGVIMATLIASTTAYELGNKQ